ncbi:hypothetical protein GCM10027402_05500 [Arthrobacter monumenti]
MAALSTYRNDIPARVAHPRSGVVEAALDKVNLAEVAFGAGLAAPHTEMATEQALAGWTGPVIVKCRAHWSQGQTRPHRIEAKLFPNIEAARKQVEHLQDAGAEAVLQTPVRGSLGALIGIFHDGRLNGRVQQNTSRLWPTPNGASARAETIPVDEDLATKAETLLHRLNWSGLVELQFLTGADGVPHLIDLNGRFFGSLALSNSARPGLIDAWGQLVLDGSMPELGDARPGIRYAWTAGDLRRAAVERRNGLAADVVDTLHWARKARHSVWNLRDPGPAWSLAAGRFTRPGRNTGKTVPQPAQR